MTTNFPSEGIAKKHKHAFSADDTALSSTITVPAVQYGVIYKLWVTCDVGDEADLEAAAANAVVGVTIGSLTWAQNIHLFILHTGTAEKSFRDLGPWSFDFGLDGFYSGVRGDDIVVSVGALGTGIRSVVDYLYSGD